ncbi:TetR/AcrR family transcriptional regulator [Actinomycetes bacterium KLBMP 9797]
MSEKLQRRSRGEPALRRAQIVSEALRLLDEEGVEALSMRRLAARLDAGAPSLYWHVSSKEELLKLAVDEVFGVVEAPDPADPVGWRPAALLCAHSIRATMLRHPWLGAVLFSESGLVHLGPNIMSLTERLLQLFVAAGFPIEEAQYAVQTLTGFVLGVAVSETAWLRSLRRAGQTEEQRMAALWPAAAAAAREYPGVRDVYAAEQVKDPRLSRDMTFGYGLDRVLDGLEARLTALGPNER